MKWPKLLTDIFGKKKTGEPGSGFKKAANDGAKQEVLEPRNSLQVYKFTGQNRRKIISYIAQCKTNREVKALVKSEMGMDIGDRQLALYRSSKKWKPIIAKEREDYLNSIMEVPGYHERIRLERADKIYEGAVASDDLELALKATEQQRKELKEKSGKDGPTNFIFQQFNNMSEEELADKYNQALIKIENSKRKQKLLESLESKEVIDGTSGI